MKVFTQLALVVLVSGCVSQSTAPSMQDEPWAFASLGTSLPSSTLVLIGSGEALGHDLVLHPADLYRLTQWVLVEEGPFAIEYTVAVEARTLRLLSMFTACGSLQEQGGAMACDDHGQLLFPSDEQTLFFSFPLVEPYLPVNDGRFSVPVQALGRSRQVEFEVTTADGLQSIRLVGPRVIEAWFLDDPRDTSGQLFDCDLFRNGVVTIGDGAIRCQDPSGFNWEFEGKLPNAEAAPPPRASPFPVAESVHGVPEDDAKLAYPLHEAVSTVDLYDPEASALMNDSQWRLAAFEFRPATSTLGGLGCRAFSWDIQVVVPDGRSATSTATRESCGGQALDSAARSTRQRPWAWPDTAAVGLSEGTAAARALLCRDDPDSTISTIVRDVTGAPERWTSFGLVPSSGIGGSAFYGIQLHTATGQLLTINHVGGAQHLERLFLAGEMC